jgi:predicted dehydrogenase
MLRGAIIGFGEVARNGHWPAYQTARDVCIAAVVERSASRRQLASTLSPSIPTFSSIDELVEWQAGQVGRSSIHFIDICTPPALHAEPMLAAIRQGWHVVCEKPLLLDGLVIDVVRQAARDAGVAVVPVHNWKYAPIVRRATTALSSGAIGTLRRIDIETTRLRAAATAERSRPNWRRDPTMAGGGILMDHGWHSVYLALHWFGQRSTSVGASFHWPTSGAVEDEACVTVGFPTGEARLALTWNGDRRSNTIRLSGDAGEILVADDALHIRGPRSETIRFEEPLSAGSHHHDWFAAMLPDLVRWLREPELSRPGYEEAAECLSIIRQAYVSGSSVSRSVS